MYRFFNKIYAIFFRFTLLGLAIMGLTYPAWMGMAQAEEVRIYNWSDYIEESVLAEFESRTGIKVIYDVFDSNELLETKLLAGGTGYDIVVPTLSFLARQIQAGVFMPLDKEKLPNLKNVWDVIAKRAADGGDPGNRYAVNYMWGTTGIGLNVKKVREVLGADAVLDSAALVLAPENMAKLANCGVHFIDSPTEIIPMTLNYIGEEPFSFETEIIAKAGPVLSAVQPFVTKFHSSEYITALANGEICVAVGWSGDVLQARDRAVEADNGVEIAYFPFREGSLMWLDMLAIPKDAPNPSAAHKFLNFLLEPEVIAKVTNYVSYANGNLASQAFIDPEILADPSIYPTEEALATLYSDKPYPAKAQRVLTRLWTQIKSGG